MTDRREGFPPTAASRSTPLHDGASEQDRAKARDVWLRTFLPEALDPVDAIAEAIADARHQTESEIIAWLERWASNMESQTVVPDPEQISIEHAWAARVAAAAVRSGQYATALPSYERSSEGTSAGGHQTPTQNEGE